MKIAKTFLVGALIGLIISFFAFWVPQIIKSIGKNQYNNQTRNHP